MAEITAYTWLSEVRFGAALLNSIKVDCAGLNRYILKTSVCILQKLGWYRGSFAFVPFIGMEAFLF